MLIDTFGYDPGFIHGMPLILDGGRILNTAVLDAFSQNSTSVRLEVDRGTLTLDNGTTKISCAPVSQPPFLSEPTSFGGIGLDFVRFHSPRTVFVTPLRECVFGTRKEICKFCTFTGQALRPAPISELVELIVKAAEWAGAAVDVAIGSGTPNLNDHGARYFGKLTQNIRASLDTKISVELVPPNNINDLSILKDAGTSSIIMSIEIWDEDRRKEICPGKSYVSRDHYISAWQHAVKLFGPGQVSSVLIVGLDTVESINDATTVLTRLGVIPTLIPFRPYDESELSAHVTTNVSDYIACSQHNSAALEDAGLSPWLQAGCTGCQGCSLDASEHWG
jgi:hypothetical protein